MELNQAIHQHATALQRREYVENRESWESEYGPYSSRLGWLGEQASALVPYVPIDREPLTVLDIGCAYGHMLKFLRQLNPGLNLYGVEIAGHAARAAEAEVGQGRIFWQGCSDPIPLPTGSVDVVLCFDMIEHVAADADLVAMAAEIRRLLRPGGMAFIETPNYNRRMQTLLKLTGQGHWLKYDHCNLFDGPRLRRIFESHLRVEDVLYRGAFNTGLKVPVIKGLFSPRHYISSNLMAVCRRD